MKILKFSASWCGPCKMMSKVLEGMELPCPVEEIDIDHNDQLPQQFGIRGVPTIVAVNDAGEELGRLVGAQAEARVKSWLVEVQEA